jgi:hypothetical protein
LGVKTFPYEKSTHREKKKYKKELNNNSNNNNNNNNNNKSVQFSSRLLSSPLATQRLGDCSKVKKGKRTVGGYGKINNNNMNCKAHGVETGEMVARGGDVNMDGNEEMNNKNDNNSNNNNNNKNNNNKNNNNYKNDNNNNNNSKNNNNKNKNDNNNNNNNKNKNDNNKQLMLSEGTYKGFIKYVVNKLWIT